jgi:hypothetical protein
LQITANLVFSITTSVGAREKFLLSANVGLQSEETLRGRAKCVLVLAEGAVKQTQ